MERLREREGLRSAAAGVEDMVGGGEGMSMGARGCLWARGDVYGDAR
jgi:hypothetical protein